MAACCQKKNNIQTCCTERFVLVRSSPSLSQTCCGCLFCRTRTIVIFFIVTPCSSLSAPPPNPFTLRFSKNHFKPLFLFRSTGKRNCVVQNSKLTFIYQRGTMRNAAVSLYSMTSYMSKQISNMAVIIIYCLFCGRWAAHGLNNAQTFCSLHVLSTFSVVILCCVSCQLLWAAAKPPSWGWHMSTKCHSLVQYLPRWFSTVSTPTLRGRTALTPVTSLSRLYRWWDTTAGLHWASCVNGAFVWLAISLFMTFLTVSH